MPAGRQDQPGQTPGPRHPAACRISPGMGQMNQEEPASGPRKRGQSRTETRDPQLPSRPERAQPAPKGMQHHAGDVGRLRIQKLVEDQVRRVKHPHLAFGQTGKPVAPQVVPDSEPAFPQRFAQNRHQSQEKVGDVTTDRHLADQYRSARAMPARPPSRPAHPRRWSSIDPSSALKNSTSPNLS